MTVIRLTYDRHLFGIRSAIVRRRRVLAVVAEPEPLPEVRYLDVPLARDVIDDDQTGFHALGDPAGNVGGANVAERV